MRSSAGICIQPQQRLAPLAETLSVSPHAPQKQSLFGKALH